jgi:hypothetical protein
VSVAHRSAYLRALEVDNTLPIDPQAINLWLRDIDRPARWFVRPLLQFLFAILLHLTWFLKRLPLPQFSAHGFLQKTICWFCRWFVTPEACLLILRHFATESNILNFLRDNSHATNVQPLKLYPESIDQMKHDTFFDHDQELFRIMAELGPIRHDSPGCPGDDLVWDNWREIAIDEKVVPHKITQILDFETSHALFMCLFCLLLTAEEYRDAINGFNLDQSIAIRIGHIIGDSSLAELAYNKFPLYLVGPWNLGQRFLMHGFFTEHVHARLEQIRVDT